ncbi:hypothetical protein ANN_03588 [Periplaneta americana]|uniref:Uncharacterized protein n=1 Tax=Periplaneta americana TaxID=6978 RepID=A0ABQ8U318_PERAM|nr:hypothetical protein ANN_03588 [Periplaneta americana]
MVGLSEGCSEPAGFLKVIWQSYFDKKATQSRKLQENLVMVLHCLAFRRYGRGTNAQNLVKQHLGLLENLNLALLRPQLLKNRTSGRGDRTTLKSEVVPMETQSMKT